MPRSLRTFDSPGGNSIRSKAKEEPPRFRNPNIAGYSAPISQQSIDYYTTGLGSDVTVEQMRAKGLPEETIREINKRKKQLEDGGQNRQEHHNFSLLDLIDKQEREKRINAANRES